MTALDPRLTPARADLAAAHLRGKIDAAHYVEGRAMHIRAEYADLRRSPSSDSPIDTQALYGENLTLYEERDGWAWVQLADDKYVGYLARDKLAEGATKSTHRVRVNRTFVYPAADLKTPAIMALPLGVGVTPADRDSTYARLAQGGFVFAGHLRSSEEIAADFVVIAEGLLGAPYLWGGKTSLGLDCSGLVQIALAEAGVAAPRDTDMQESALGVALPISENLAGLRRGDLVFWKGHVGIMRDSRELLHANAYAMLVASEPLAQARDRIRQKGAGEITSIRRP